MPLPTLPKITKTSRLKSAPPTVIKHKGPNDIVGIPKQDIQRMTLDITQGEFEERYQKALKNRHYSREEFIVYEYLTINKRQVEGVDFLFQSNFMGGRRVKGGKVVDFWLFKRSTVWRVQGERFHILEAKSRAKDLIERALLVASGSKVIDLYAQDLDERPLSVLDAAWEGRELVKAQEKFF